MELTEIFREGGLLSQSKANYKFRPQQYGMAELVQKAIMDEKVALIEGQCGSGKSLAYLIPAIMSGGQIVISTATKNLQDQLMNTDLPFLKSILPDFTYVCIKGRKNYICLDKLKTANGNVASTEAHKTILSQIKNWASITTLGDKDDIPDITEEIPFWNKIDARAEACSGQLCNSYNDCFIIQLRKKAQTTRVIVTNHYVLMTELTKRGDLFGQPISSYKTIILDEGHEVEDIACSSFELMYDFNVVNKILKEIDSNQYLFNKDINELLSSSRILENLNLASYDILMSLLQNTPTNDRGYEQKDSLPYNLFFNDGIPTQVGESILDVIGIYERLLLIINRANQQLPVVTTLCSKIEHIIYSLKFIFMMDNPNYVFWYAKDKSLTLKLYATPINVSEELEDILFNVCRSIIITSATLTTSNSFEFIKSRLGISNNLEIIASSPFNFKQQSVMYLSKNIPHPQHKDYPQSCLSEIKQILEISKGHAFILFTNIQMMKLMCESLRYSTNYPILMQGEMSKSRILDAFRNTPNAVLLGTNSFWQGVDIQGKSLSCVIIPKLPFTVPSDPVLAARCREIDKIEGKNAFMDYIIPMTIMMLKQGTGRLVRSQEDTGILSILDSRLLTKNYGKTIMRSLPDFAVSNDLDRVRQLSKGFFMG